MSTSQEPQQILSQHIVEKNDTPLSEHNDINTATPPIISPPVPKSPDVACHGVSLSQRRPRGRGRPRSSGSVRLNQSNQLPRMETAQDESLPLGHDHATLDLLSPSPQTSAIKPRATIGQLAPARTSDPAPEVPLIQHEQMPEVELETKPASGTHQLSQMKSLSTTSNTLSSPIPLQLHENEVFDLQRMAQQRKRRRLEFFNGTSGRMLRLRVQQHFPVLDDRSHWCALCGIWRDGRRGHRSSHKCDSCFVHLCVKLHTGMQKNCWSLWHTTEQLTPCTMAPLLPISISPSKQNLVPSDPPEDLMQPSSKQVNDYSTTNTKQNPQQYDDETNNSAHIYKNPPIDDIPHSVNDMRTGNSAHADNDQRTNNDVHTDSDTRTENSLHAENVLPSQSHNQTSEDVPATSHVESLDGSSDLLLASNNVPEIE